MDRDTNLIKILAGLVAESCNWRVIWFAIEMQRVLTEQRRSGKQGWENMSDKQILHRIRQETIELAKAKTNREKIDEAVDVANFALFFAMRYVTEDGDIEPVALQSGN